MRFVYKSNHIFKGLKDEDSTELRNKSYQYYW